MNAFQQFKQFSTLVADTADLNDIKRFGLADVTTNPSILKKAGHRQSEALSVGEQILSVIPGTLSLQVDPEFANDLEMTLAQARAWWRHFEGKRVMIKIPATGSGIAAMRILEKEGIRCNMTLLFTLEQAFNCMGATCIAPYVGRVSDWHRDEMRGVQFVKKIFDEYRKAGCSTKIMAASFRSLEQIVALAGISYLTISPKLLQELQASDALVEMLDVSDAKAPESAVIEKLGEGIDLFKRDAV